MSQASPGIRELVEGISLDECRGVRETTFIESMRGRSYFSPGQAKWITDIVDRRGARGRHRASTFAIARELRAAGLHRDLASSRPPPPAENPQPRVKTIEFPGKRPETARPSPWPVVGPVPYRPPSPPPATGRPSARPAAWSNSPVYDRLFPNDFFSATFRKHHGDDFMGEIEQRSSGGWSENPFE